MEEYITIWPSKFGQLAFALESNADLKKVFVKGEPATGKQAIIMAKGSLWDEFFKRACRYFYLGTLRERGSYIGEYQNFVNQFVGEYKGKRLGDFVERHKLDYRLSRNEIFGILDKGRNELLALARLARENISRKKPRDVASDADVAGFIFVGGEQVAVVGRADLRIKYPEGADVLQEFKLQPGTWANYQLALELLVQNQKNFVCEGEVVALEDAKISKLVPPPPQKIQELLQLYVKLVRETQDPQIATPQPYLV